MIFIKKIFFILTVIFTCTLCVYAHPGSTDDYGGHVDWETGEYHYHHGYEAHFHDGGVCPYDFVDNSDHSNHSSSSSSNYTYNYGDRDQFVPKVQYDLISPSTPEATNQPSITWSIVEETLVLGALFSVIPFLIYLFASAHFVKVSQNEHRLRFPIICSFAGCSFAQYCKITNFANAWNIYFFIAWLLIADLAYEYFLYVKARNKYRKMYENKDSSVLAGVPDGIIFLGGAIPHFTDETTREKYTVYVSSSNKYHQKNCKHSKQPFSCFLVDNKMQPCKICKPEIPDLSWFYKYQEIEKIKKDYNIK